MEAVVLCEPKFGAGPIQTTIDYLVVEKRYRVVGAALVARKTPKAFRLEVPVVAARDAVAAVREAVASFHPRVIIDITEIPVEGRLVWATEALRLGVEVHGADYRLWPPELKKIPGIPTVSFVGAGSGVGKTAAIINFINGIRTRYRAAALVLDLGGPSYPELVEPFGEGDVAARLLAYQRDGRRIDGDHYLIAAAARVAAVGCSFAGTGFTGVPVASVVADGAVLAAETGAEFLVVEGSGQAIPPTATGAVCLLVNIKDDGGRLGHLPTAYQVARAHMVVATGFKAEPAAAWIKLRNVVKRLNPGAVCRYAPLIPDWFGPPTTGDVVVVTARPPEDAGVLVRFWARRLKGAVRDVISAHARTALALGAKALARGGGPPALLLDMAVPALGEWLELASARKAEICPTYEVLAPVKPLFAVLVREATRAVPS